VRLPVAPVEHASVPPTAPERVAPPAPTTTLRVLVVDDNSDGAEMLVMLLERCGHVTHMAHTGPEALSAAGTFAPDVTFLDIGLPEMDGYEVARRLRADPVTAGTVLVALTGWGSEDDKRKSKEAGFDVHLTKPVDAGVVKGLLAQVPNLTKVSTFLAVDGG
jgi:CheY-like chemotaxis protein